MRRLTRTQARRVAIAAQGLASPRPTVSPNVGHVRRAIRTMGLLQIDSVNVVERAHHLTLFSRLGPHDPGLLWRSLEKRRLFEYWARMASFVPIEDFPLYRHRMERHAARERQELEQIEAKAPGYVESVYRQVVEKGPITVADLDEPGERRGPWWGWADGKLALEYLFSVGRVSVAFRRNFTRYYDITERVIPREQLETTVPTREEAQEQLIRQAARSVGVGTIRDIIDYYWIRVAEGKPILARLVESGDLVEVEVEGWPQPAYMPAETTVPRALHVRSLINPFDPLVWNRDRIERLHDFTYRIEIYTPQPKRVHGYYVFPFLLGDDLVARVDLKADRKTGVLQVPGSFLEDGVDPAHVAGELAVELGEMARWLKLSEIEVGRKGDLAPQLRKAV